MLEFLKMLPAKVRLWIYAVAALIAFAIGVWRASDGHWDQFGYLLLTSLVNALSGANVTLGSPEEKPRTDGS